MSDTAKTPTLPSKGGSYVRENGKLKQVEKPTGDAPKKRKSRTRKSTRKAD